MITLYAYKEDYAAAESWRLVEWALARGASQFTLSFLGPPDAPPETWAAVDAELARFQLPAEGADRYALSRDALDALRRVLTEGLFTYDWGLTSLEDPTFYRDGTRLLTVITHEAEAVLEIRPDEQASLDIAGLPYRLKSRWA